MHGGPYAPLLGTKQPGMMVNDFKGVRSLVETVSGRYARSVEGLPLNHERSRRHHTLGASNTSFWGSLPCYEQDSRWFGRGAAGDLELVAIFPQIAGVTIEQCLPELYFRIGKDILVRISHYDYAQVRTRLYPLHALD